LNPVVTRSLKAPGFNPWNLKCDFLVSNFAFKFNLYRYSLGLLVLFGGWIMVVVTARLVGLYKRGEPGWKAPGFDP
jgi:hypothetical protein